MANFNFYLNRQGVRGKKGEKGDQGFSPDISIKTDTPTEFIMTVNNELDSFDTPNLIPTAIGKKVTELDATVTTHTQEIASLTTEVDANKSLIDTNSEDILRLYSDVSKNIGDISVQATQISDLTTQVNSSTDNMRLLKTVLDQSVSKIIENEVNIESLETKKQNKLKAGDNITLVDNSDGTTTISAKGGSGGGGDVTAAGDNTFTGINRFEGASTEINSTFTYFNGSAVEFRNGLNVDNELVFSTHSVMGQAHRYQSSIQAPSSKLFISGQDGVDIVVGNSLYKYAYNVETRKIDEGYFLSQDTVEAGDNVTIENTAKGIKISATGSSSESEIDKVIESSSTTNSVVLTPKDGKTLDLSNAPMVAVGENLVNNIDGEDHQLYLKQGDIAAGNNITIEETATGIKVSASGGGETPIATTEIAGKVKPDGSSITITEDGTISATSSILSSVVTTHTQEIASLTTEVDANKSLIDTNSEDILRLNSEVAKNTEDISAQATQISDLTTQVNLNTEDISLIETVFDQSIYDIHSRIERLETKKQNKLKAGDNITLVDNSDGTTTISAKGGSGGGGVSSVADKNGIEADYKVKHGIVDCPNGIITYSAANKDIVIKQGLVLNCAGNGSAKTTISADILYTVDNSIPFTLFYAQDDLLECPDVYWQEEEPENNGQTGYQAWWNPNKETNPDQQWQFRSNDTGNVFRTVNSATPIADINAGADFITSVSYLGYRVTDDDIIVTKKDTEFIAHQAMPSNKFKDLTLGASGATYTAPADGYYYFGMSGGTAGSFIFLQSSTGLGFRLVASGTGQIRGFCPVVKGDVVTITYNEPTTNIFRFYYCVGSNQ